MDEFPTWEVSYSICPNFESLWLGLRIKDICDFPLRPKKPFRLQSVATYTTYVKGMFGPGLGVQGCKG